MNAKFEPRPPQIYANAWKQPECAPEFSDRKTVVRQLILRLLAALLCFAIPFQHRTAARK